MGSTNIDVKLNKRGRGSALREPEAARVSRVIEAHSGGISLAGIKNAGV